MKKFVFFILLLGVIFNELNAQFVYENKIYSPLIKTVTIRPWNELYGTPVIHLSEAKKLILEFDELTEETHRYEYTLILCNSDWTQSELTQDRYIEGFEVQSIETFENSFNTIQRYVHYTQIIPSNNMYITKSGNYIIKVFTEGNPNNVIFTQRLYVLDNKTNMELEVKPSSLAPLLATHQEVNVKVSSNNGEFFSNPEQYMKVVAIQNDNENAVHNLKMRGMSGSKIDYSFDISNQFEGYNEFRFFDITSLRQRSQYVANFDFQGGQNQVYLRQERLRHKLPYTYDKDLNGEFYIRNEYGDNLSTTSDYAWVHFTYPAPMTLEGKYYVVGGMNNWHANTLSQMNFIDGKYRLSMYLKQGYYNYYILFKHNSDTQLSAQETEGNFSQTNNKYTVFVYYHDFSDNYDRLIGYSSVEYNR